MDNNNYLHKYIINNNNNIKNYNEHNEFNIFELNKPRIKNDIATDIYCNTFFSCPTIRYSFIDLINKIINFNLNLNLNFNNKNFNDNNYKNYNFIFKGGNILSYFYNEHMKKKFNEQSKNEDFDEFFKISDVDFGLYIYSKNNDEFKKFKNECKINIYESLDFISTLFDYIYTSKVDIINNYNINNESDINNLDLNFLKYIIKNKIFNKINIKYNDDNIFIDILKNNKINSLDFNNIDKNNIDEYFIELIKSIIKFYNYNFYNINLMNQYIDNYNIKFNNKFNNENLKKSYEIKNELDNIIILKKITYNYNDCYFIKPNNNIILNDFNFLRKKNGFIINDNTEDNIVLPEERYHFISINNTTKYQRDKYIIVNFDLMRIKVNSQPTNTKRIIINNEMFHIEKNDYDELLKNNSIENPNIVNIVENKSNDYYDGLNEKTDYYNYKYCEHMSFASEFIDISICNNNMYISDKELINNKNNENNENIIKRNINKITLEIEKSIEKSIENRNICLYTMSIEELYYDLEYMLFGRNNIIYPWFDNKYIKRINRLLIYGYFIYNRDEYNKLMNYIIKGEYNELFIDLSTINTYLKNDYYDYYDNYYNKENINEDYRKYSNIILKMYFLNYTKDNNKIKELRTFYNLNNIHDETENTKDNYNNNYSEFINNLNLLNSKLYEYDMYYKTEKQSGGKTQTNKIIADNKIINNNNYINTKEQLSNININKFLSTYKENVYTSYVNKMLYLDELNSELYPDNNIRYTNNNYEEYNENYLGKTFTFDITKNNVEYKIKYLESKIK